MPAPYASPKCRNPAGDTTSTSIPRARRRSTASAMNRPATSPGARGYDVVRSATFTGRSFCSTTIELPMATAIAPEERVATDPYVELVAFFDRFAEGSSAS